MSRVQIEVESNELDRVSKILAGVTGGIGKAASRALKRAGDKAKSEAGSFAAREYTLSKGEFMKRVDVKTDVRDGSMTTSLSINFRGATIPLIMFNTKHSLGGTVTAQVKRGQGGAIHRAFAARVYHGRLRLFERVGKARLPVEQKFGPSGAQMMRNEDITEDMTNIIRETFDERLEHEAWQILSGTR